MHHEGEGTLARLVALLETLARRRGGDSRGCTVSELARLVGRDKSSVSRQLRTLTELGLVEKDHDGLHFLGWRLFTIGALAGDQRLLLLAPPVMRQIARSTGERVHLSVRRQDEVLTILTEGDQRVVGSMNWVGRTVPLINTSSGRALLFDDNPEEIEMLFSHGLDVRGGPRSPQHAEQLIERVARARATGYAAVEDEYEEGTSGIAAPIRSGRGRITAVVNVSGPSIRFAPRLEGLGRMIQAAAAHLSRVVATPEDQRGNPSFEANRSEAVAGPRASETRAS